MTTHIPPHTATAVMPTAPIWLPLNAMTVSSVPCTINRSMFRISLTSRSHDAKTCTGRPCLEKRLFTYPWSCGSSLEGRRKDAAMIFEKRMSLCWWVGLEGEEMDSKVVCPADLTLLVNRPI